MTTRSWIRNLFSRSLRATRKPLNRCRPTVSKLECRLTPAYPVMTPVAGGANPFSISDTGDWSTPALADVDGDADLDAVVGDFNGTLRYLRNFGTTANPVYLPQTGVNNPFNAIGVGSLAKPALGDVDGDGDLDAIVGGGGGTLSYFKNTGNATSPIYTQQIGAANPFNALSIGTGSAPSVCDIDADGDVDLAAGWLGGNVLYFKNTGSATNPAYTQQTGAANPFGSVSVPFYSTPMLGDIDNDGDHDLIVGEEYGSLFYFKNTGTPNSPTYTQQSGAANPFNGVNVGFESAPAMGDVNGDGDLDVVVGESGGTLRFVRNDAVPPAVAVNLVSIFNLYVQDAAPAVGDMDGDGDKDYFLGNDEGTLLYFKNTGTATSPVYTEQTGAANPFNGVDLGFYSAPALGDIDGDGDLDAFVGETSGFVFFYKNTGTATNPIFVLQPGGVDIGYGATPAFGDIDSDGDLDLVVGEAGQFNSPIYGQLFYFKNMGTATSSAYVQQTGAANPFSAINAGDSTAPTLGDVDGDGDLDLLVGELLGETSYYKNTGTPTSPVYAKQTGAANPCNQLGLNLYHTKPVLVDMDADGDNDVLLGLFDTYLVNPTVRYYRANRVPVLDTAIPDQTFTGAGQHTFTLPTNTFVDLDNNPLTHSATLVGGGALPAWLNLNPTTGIFSGNPGSTAPSPLQIRVTANDGFGATVFDDFQLTLVNVNDAPTDLALLNSTVAENQSSGAVVGNFTTSDADFGDSHAYTLVAGTGSTDNGLFTISGTTLKTAASFDFETKSSYSIRVRTSDLSGVPFEKALTINITNVNESPTDITLSKSSVDENQGVGAVVGNFTTTDPDAGDSHGYILVSGTGSGDNGLFTLSGNTLKTAVTFDYEAKSTYSIRAQSIDAGMLAVEKIFSITIINANDAPTDIALSINAVAENQPVGTAIGSLSTTDTDAGDSHTYTLVGGTGGNDNGLFTISGNTLKTAASFDYELKSSYSIRVRSADAGSLFVDKVFTINVINLNEMPTEFLVTNDADSGSGSLRQAVINANGNPGADTISFHPTFFATAKTIALTTGELAVTESLTITGPTGSVTVSGNNASRVFNLAMLGTGSVSLSDLTITNGSASGGAGILANDDNLSLTRCTVSNNISSHPTFQGGGVSTGGAAGTWNFTDSTFSGNTGGRGGAIYFFTFGTLNMTGCTVSGNKSTDANGGGGLYNYQNSATIINSTFSGNQALSGAGGAIQIFSNAAVAVRNSTITGNTAATTGGGIIQQFGGSLSLSSTIVAGNTASSAAVSDLASFGAVNVGSDNNLVGVMDAANNVTLTGMGDLTGTTAIPLDAKLGLLAANGGPTLTHSLLAGSPALNAGNNSYMLSTDQRGIGFLRESGAADIGAFEVQAKAPTVTAIQVNDGSAQRSMVTSLKITFSETVSFPSGINAAFQLNRTGPSSPIGTVNLSAVQSANTVTITFVSGGVVGIDPVGSLRDGRYDLTVFADKITSNGFTLDGDANGIAGDNYLSIGAPGTGPNLFRLFGDFDGDGTVAANDFIQFRLALGGTNPIFDFDGDGAVAASDFIQFRLRFGGSV